MRSLPHTCSVAGYIIASPSSPSFHVPIENRQLSPAPYPHAQTHAQTNTDTGTRVHSTAHAQQSGFIYYKDGREVLLLEVMNLQKMCKNG